MFAPYIHGCCCVSQYILNYTRNTFFLTFLFLPPYDGKLVPHIFLLPCPSFYIIGTHEAFWHNLNTVRSWVSRFGAGSVVMELKALLYLIRILFSLGAAAGLRNVIILIYHISTVFLPTQRNPISYWACHVHIHALDILTPLEIVKRSIGTMNRRTSVESARMRTCRLPNQNYLSLLHKTFSIVLFPCSRYDQLPPNAHRSCFPPPIRGEAVS